MKIIGCDYHPSGQQVFGIDTESGEVFADRWIARSGKELEEFYGGLPAGAVVGVECSGNMLWFERRRLGGISKQGSSFMRLLLIQGARTAVGGDED
jgi:hypothetical protein